MREYRLAEKIEYPEIYKLIKKTFGESALYPEHPTIVCKEDNKTIGCLSTNWIDKGIEVVSLCVDVKIKSFIALRLLEKMEKVLQENGLPYYYFVIKQGVENKWYKVAQKLNITPYGVKNGYDFYLRMLC